MYYVREQDIAIHFKKYYITIHIATRHVFFILPISGEIVPKYLLSLHQPVHALQCSSIISKFLSTTQNTYSTYLL